MIVGNFLVQYDSVMRIS